MGGRDLHEVGVHHANTQEWEADRGALDILPATGDTASIAGHGGDGKDYRIDNDIFQRVCRIGGEGGRGNGHSTRQVVNTGYR